MSRTHYSPCPGRTASSVSQISLEIGTQLPGCVPEEKMDALLFFAALDSDSAAKGSARNGR
jgi:hypothetical protein